MDSYLSSDNPACCSKNFGEACSFPEKGKNENWNGPVFSRHDSGNNNELNDVVWLSGKDIQMI